MENWWSTVLWRQFGAAIDVLDKALVACPPSMWTERLWPVSPGSAFPPQFGEFWHISFHTLVWLDLYVTGVPEAEFPPPAPFAPGEIDSAEGLPARPYSKEELRGYLESVRGKCRSALTSLTDDQARRTLSYPWIGAEPISYFELQIYNMRHVQEHGAQLSLFIGQHAVPDADLDWIPRAG